MRLVRVKTIAAVVALAALSLIRLSAQTPELSRAASDAMHQKVIAIEGRAPQLVAAGATHTPIRTSFTEAELNSYLKYGGVTEIPPGVNDPYVTLDAQNHVSGRAILDLDTVRKSQPRGTLDPMAYLTGSLEVKITGVLRTSAGRASFDLITATVAGMSVKPFVQGIVSSYTKTPDRPNGIQFDQPFALAYGIQSIEIQKGSATIIQ